MNDKQRAEMPKARILIVEDQTAVAMMMVYLLTQAGCETEVAATGKKAMQLAAEGDFDLITLDVDLPDANGFKICSRLKENPCLCDTPVCFVSGRPCEQDVQRGFEVGAVDYITKPFDALDFAPRLLSYIKIEGESDSIAAAKGHFQER
jgi:DNA-binding response OmpR family regulator